MVQAKAIEALRDKPFRHSLDAVRALETANASLSRMQYMHETTRLELAAVNGEHLRRTESGDSSFVDALTDNQLARRLLQVEERERRVRASKTAPTNGGGPG
ncbi:MAG: hypothetical protein IT454_19920 [Planctomycetes bacterium]|nr:hypothetical protein [Planctomycetota bacterium]